MYAKHTNSLSERKRSGEKSEKDSRVEKAEQEKM
jgi:hypothetical protein